MGLGVKTGGVTSTVSRRKRGLLKALEERRGCSASEDIVLLLRGDRPCSLAVKVLDRFTCQECRDGISVTSTARPPNPDRNNIVYDKLGTACVMTATTVDKQLTSTRRPRTRATNGEEQHFVNNKRPA